MLNNKNVSFKNLLLVPFQAERFWIQKNKGALQLNDIMGDKLTVKNSQRIKTEVELQDVK